MSRKQGFSANFQRKSGLLDSICGRVVKRGDKMSYDGWMLAAIDKAGYNGIRSEHIYEVANELLRTGLTEIDRSTFNAACNRCGIDPSCFTQADLDELENVMNR